MSGYHDHSPRRAVVHDHDDLGLHAHYYAPDYLVEYHPDGGITAIPAPRTAAT